MWQVNDHAYADLEPKPTIELDFWSGRSRELHAILEQLRHPKLRNAVEVFPPALSHSGATMENPAGIEVELSVNEMSMYRALFN